jgi:hypothetical protein
MASSKRTVEKVDEEGSSSFASAMLSSEAAPVPLQESRWEDSGDSLVAYFVLASLIISGQIIGSPIIKANELTDLPYFVGLAVTTIYIGELRLVGRYCQVFHTT